MQHLYELIKDIPPPPDGAARYDVASPGSDCGTCGDAGVVKSRRLTIGETGEASIATIIRCPDCTIPPLRNTLLHGVERIVSFDDWQPHSSTNPALKACRELLAGERWCVFMRGSYGLGKTHLAIATAYEWTARGQPAVFVNVPDFLATLKATFDDDNRNTSSETYGARFDSYAETPLLVLDDLGTEYRTHWAQAELFRIIDKRYQRRAPLIVTSNTRYDTELDGRLLSRLSPGEVVITGGADRRKEFER